MNLRDVLRMSGYDIMEERITEIGEGWRYEYDLRFTLERRIRLREAEETRCRMLIDFEAIHSVYVDEAGFNGYGDLYVCLSSINDDSCFDVIEFENGKLRDIE